MHPKSNAIGMIAAATAALLLSTQAPAQNTGSSTTGGGYGSSMQNQTTTPSATPAQQMPSTSGTMGSQTSAPQPLGQVSDPTSKLAAASVRDSTGQAVGQVESVQTANGKASSVKVTLASTRKVVRLKASNLRYDPSNNSLVTSLTSTQINSLPTVQTP